MERAEIIAAIEKLRQKPDNETWRTEFIEKVSRRHQSRSVKRSALGDDFHRAVVYCFVIFTRVGYVNKETRAFLRPTKRAIWIAVCLVLAVLLEIVFFVVVATMFSFGVYFVLIVILILLFQVGYINSIVTKLQASDDADDLGMNLACVGCSYPLTGLDSALGDSVWVGPAVCPECGLEYPAIGK